MVHEGEALAISTRGNCAGMERGLGGGGSQGMDMRVELWDVHT